MSDDETPEEIPEGASRAAGACLVAVLGIGAVAALLVIAPTVGLLLLWGGGAVALWWAVDDSRRSKIDNPSPPPPEAPSENEKPQFRVVDDPDNPARHRVVWDTEKENES